MKISVPTSNGLLLDKYSKHAAPEQIYNGNPSISFPIDIQDVPDNATTLALTLLDFDAVPVCGFPWIHWTAVNIPADKSVTIPENASQSNVIDFIQGNNSTAGSLIGATDPLTTRHYIGPTPPDKNHDYWLSIYALDTTLSLQNGFWLNEFYHAAKGHIISKQRLSIISRA
ncbi:Phospholipid-binding protein [Pediococcus damnosus]|uniref:Phospholipid-binding protein n=1 Tax=Pediococcus damnosus TaxID=51663 RepID=A0A0R2HDR4_9LACO|nr:YbhB/YbcL family Raf kinase inhibitor-like protein [Pediococcus damnosus]AMV60343.1 Phospholipid-binding protein [Pediococcus damnosus]AMV62877.1 Phospholipid-binding protein [Pediococcus damnosus]AMV64593.1 Phospholipid-binding protein [Pediococcus damnosus]AMV67239.1 Phospholipid-binding protein [Pediococcus damnosus]AMV69543.1 Phospholipid-binding protein [Pediococcus damnosus]